MVACFPSIASIQCGKYQIRLILSGIFLEVASSKHHVNLLILPCLFLRFFWKLWFYQYDMTNYVISESHMMLNNKVLLLNSLLLVAVNLWVFLYECIKKISQVSKCIWGHAKVSTKTWTLKLLLIRIRCVTPCIDELFACLLLTFENTHFHYVV